MTDEQALTRFADAPVARLATASADAIPHLVPIVFAVLADTVYTAVDGKPKTTQRLRRLVNIEQNPQVSVLVDHYAQDWSQLWWVRGDGIARVHHDDTVAEVGLTLLRAKYAQYQAVPLDGPVIAIEVTRWSSWSG
ncbi:TIGR03668 family PPOX class F420-dependent oxidoreductase [soil metagenome]